MYGGVSQQDLGGESVSEQTQSMLRNVHEGRIESEILVIKRVRIWQKP